jgi:lysyl endopeptidase
MTTLLAHAGRAFGALAAVLALSPAALTQAGAGGSPPSRTLRLEPTAAVEVMPPVDVAALLAEDELNAGKLMPYRFGQGIDVALGLQNAGSWEDLPNGQRLWRLRVQSPGAYSLNLIFDHYALPEGAQLFVHNAAGQVLGAFTAELNQPHGLFATEPLAGDSLTLEYTEPQSLDVGQLRLTQVIHAYKNILGPGANQGAGHQLPGVLKSGACNINVNCPLGANWQDVKRASARVFMGGNQCSGALINNTAGDSKQYFLSANHCFSGNPATWVFNFNYESPTCAGTSGTSDTVSGSILRTKSSAADHCLVEITQDIPAAYNVFLSGWSRSTTPSTMSTGIHHPLGDIKKICRDSNTALTATFNGSPCWRVASWEQGVTEGGSSGSPLYDQNKRLVGQLFGGQATCSFLFNDYYGRFDVSWNNGLSTWLDPLGTGQQTMDGIFDNQGNQPTPYCTGKTNSQGFVPAIDFFGSASLATQNFNLVCNGGIPGNNTLVFWGNGQNSAPFFGGTLCVLPPLTRGGIQVFDIFGLVVTPIPVTANMVGTKLYYQYWGRDPAHPDGTATLLSNALEVPFIP